MPPLDDVLAFAAWFAYHGIPMRPNCDHPLLRAMPWNPDNCEVLDEAAENLLNPEGYSDRDLQSSREAHEIFSELPANAHRYALRLLFFEIALAPLAANANELLRVIERSLRTPHEVVPEMLKNPGQLGQFLYGPYGVIVRKSKVNNVLRPRGGYSGLISALSDALGWSGSDVSGPVGHPSEGWSEEQLLLWSEQELLDPESLRRDNLFFSLRGSRNWMPGIIQENVDATPQTELLKRTEDARTLMRALKTCVNHDRKHFFAETATWDYAPGAKSAIDLVGKGETDLGLSESRQLMLMTSLEQMCRCFNDCGCVPKPLSKRDSIRRALSVSEQMIHGPRLVPPWAAKQLFSINLARALEEAYSRVGRLSDLDKMTTAEGERLQRVLHFVLRLGAENVLRSRLFEPEIASALAAITYCSLTFGQPGSWDITDISLQSRLFEEIEAGLCFRAPPRLQQKVNPCDLREAYRFYYQGDQPALKRYGNQARTHAEWVLKTVIQWAYTVWTALDPATKTHYGPLPLEVPSVEPFFPAKAFGDLVDAERLRFMDSDLCLSHMTLEPLYFLLGSLDKILRWEDRPQMKPMFEAHKQLRSLYARYEVAKNGNICSHDQIPEPSLQELQVAIERLIAFDEEARKLEDAFPRFLTLSEVVQRPNDPYRATFCPLPRSDGASDATEERREFYFTKNWLLGGGRVYAALHVTRNTLSLDPILVDWTNWVEQGT